MNKKDDDNMTVSTIPFDKNEISYSFQKESKKLTRLPFYKLEELKKLEEKKLKNPHKLKKKEDYIHAHSQPSQHLPKTKKIILKKIKDEEKKISTVLKKSDLEDITNITTQVQPKEVGDELKLLKYSVNEINQKKIKLSRKQRKLQEAENTLASFMTKEEKNNLYNNDESISKFNKQNSLNNQNSLNMQNSINNRRLSSVQQTNLNESKLQINSNSNVVIVNNNNIKGSSLVLMGKKRKRLNKYKKAVYKYRFEKKQFIVNNLFNMEKVENQKVESEVPVSIINQEINNPIKEKESASISDENINQKVEMKIENNKNNESIYKQPSIDGAHNYMLNYYGNVNQNSYQYYQQNQMIQSPQFQKNNFYYNQTYQPFYYYYPQNAYNDYNYKFYNYNNYLPMYYYNHPFRQPELFIQKNKFDLNIKKNDFDFKKSTGKKKIIHTKEKNKTFTRQKVEGDKKGFIFETEKLNNAVGNSDNKNENYMEYLKKNHNLDKNIRELQGSEFNNSIENSELKKISLKSLNKIADQKLVKTYVQRYEGIAPDSNVNKKIIREYVDQILDNEFDKRFSDFVVKMRDIYFKKKLLNPLKVKKRFVVGMREIEKYLKLEEVKLVFFVPNIEKVEGENSLDSRILKILKECDKKNVPRFFGLNKFKLGKIARKKHSNVSILAFINVEGFEREFSDLIELGQKFIKNFYEKYQDKKDMFVNNKFIDMNSFDLYKKV